jgi:endonuclease-3 related protein
MSSTLQEAYELLYAHYGPQGWWPGQSPLEVMVGAVLVQNTSWANVERALESLRDAGALDICALSDLPLEELAELIRPAGYYRLKARRLANLVQYVCRRYDGSLEAMFSTGVSTLREELLALNGIGPETADAILLYAGQLPAFVVDAYTHRVLARHGWVDFDSDYHSIQDYCQSSLPAEVPLYNELHALLVRVGKDHCRKQQPLCNGCPLAPLLPPNGPLEPC